MAVQKSPFSRTASVPPRGYGFDENGNPIYVTADGTIRQLSVSSKDSGGKPKTTFSEEKTRLEDKTKRIVTGLAQNPNLSFVQQAQARSAALAIAAGGKASVSDKGALGGLLKGLTSIPGRVAGKAFDIYEKAVDPFQSVGQSAVKELVDVFKGQGASLDDFIRQSRMDNFKAADALGIKNKWIRGIGNFALDTIFDPTTYLTMGGSAASKAARFALANRAALLVPKYPELKPLLSNIARYGATEIPPAIRQAEGIAAGVKYMGKQVPYTSGLAKAWRYTLAPVRAGIGDVVGATTVGKVVMQKTTTESLKDLTLAGFGRKATQNVYKPEFVQGLMEMASSDWAKAVQTTALRQALGEIQTLMDNARSAGELDDNINQVYRAIERGTDEGLSEPAKEVYAGYKAWESKLRDEVVQVQTGLAETYGLAVSEMGFLENHLFHMITPEAKDWILSQGGRTRSGFKSTDLTDRDLLETGGTLAYRRLRAPVRDEAGNIIEQSEFLGRKVDDATIDGLNKISQEELGFKWFSDDLGAIAQGYAESIARAKSRVAYVNSAMRYGPDAIKALPIKEIVKDEELVLRLTSARDALVKTQRRLRDRMRKRVGLPSTVATAGEAGEQFARVLDDVLSGRMVERTVRDSELDEATTMLNEVFDMIEAARLASLRVKQDAKGEFDDLWGGLMREAEDLRRAIANNTADRHVLLYDLRTEYARMAGLSADATELDGRSVEWFAERLKRMANGGRSEPREQARLLARQAELREQLDALPSGAQFDSSRQAIVDRLDEVEMELEGVRVLGEVREQASYAGDGVIWGSVPDATDEAAPFQVWTTKPVDDEFGTFSRMPDSLMGHAIPEEELVDFRNPEMMAQMVSAETVGDTIARVFREVGIEDPTWQSVVAETFESGIVDDTLRMVSPAKADLLEGFLDFGRMIDDAIEQGVDLTEFEIESFFGWLQSNFQQIAAEFSLDNSDVVANTMVNNLLRGLTDDAFDSGFRGLLVPMRTIFTDLDDIASEWAVVLPKDTPTPVVGTGVTDEWQTVMDNPLADSLLRGSTESYELDLMAKGDRLRTEGLDLQALEESKQALARELEGITSPVDDLAARARSADTVRYNGVDVPVKKARKTLASMDETVAKESRNIDRQVDEVLKDEFGLSPEAESMRMALEDRLTVLMNNAQAMDNWDATMGNMIRNELEGVRLLLTRKPAKGSTNASNAAWVKQVQKTLEGSALLDFDPVLRDAYERVTALMHLGEVDLAKATSQLAEVNLKLSKAEAGEIGKITFDAADRGWKALEGMGVQVPDEVAKKWRPNLTKLRDTAEAEKLWKYVNNLNNYWKRYVTASVGFFLRNGFSATFMNYADGVGLNEMTEGLRWARALADSKTKIRRGDTYANWMERAGVTNAEEAEQVLRIVAATGRGMSDDFAIPSFNLAGTKGNIISRASNGYLGFFSRKNDLVENAVRIPMALDSVRRGEAFEEAVARIRRVHFDYSDLSTLDEKTKRFVPFWIWTSRNIPLQISQMVTRPKAYAQYERLKREFPVNEELMVPSWIQKLAPLGAGPGAVLTPDLPQVRLAENLKQIGTVTGLIGQTTPLVRVPVELWVAKRQVALDIPFGDKRTAKGVESALGKLINALAGSSLAEVDAQTGQVLIDPRVTYVVEQALPILAQSYRLSGGYVGGKETLEERWLGNVLNWFGIPYRQVGEQQQRSEAIRRNFELSDLEKELKSIIEKGRP